MAVVSGTVMYGGGPEEQGLEPGIPPPTPRRAPAAPHHAQVVHEARAVLPDLGRAAGQGLHADLLAPVQLLHRSHHSIDGVKQQGRGELGEGGQRAGGQRERGRDRCKGGGGGRGKGKEEEKRRGRQGKRETEEIRAPLCRPWLTSCVWTRSAPHLRVQALAQGRQGWQRLLWDSIIKLSLWTPNDFKAIPFSLRSRGVATSIALRIPKKGMELPTSGQGRTRDTTFGYARATTLSGRSLTPRRPHDVLSSWRHHPTLSLLCATPCNG